MRIFLDTADTDLIAKHYNTGLIDGITTNPTLIMKSGRNPEDVYRELADNGLTDISMEVVGDRQVMLDEGRRLSRDFGDVATIKVPCTPDGLRVCRMLSAEGIRVNVTLIFSPSQAILAAKAGAKYVSPFVGRVDDNSFGGLCLIKDISNVFNKQMWFDTEILAASIRNVRDVGRAFEYGANICTLPPKVFEGMYNHILTEKGLQLFDEDWAQVTGSNI
jgi:transaldolase